MREIFMQYYAQFESFWQQYGWWIAVACAAVLLLTILYNVARNDYRSVNRKLTRSKAVMPRLLGQGNRQRFEDSIPQPYLAQYRCYRRTTNLKANEVISFVPVRQRVTGIWLMAICLLAVAVHTAMLAVHNAHFVQYWITASTVVVFVGGLFAIRAVHKAHKRKAQRVLNTYLAILTAVEGVSEGEQAQQVVSQEKVNNAVQSIQIIGKSTDGSTALSKVREVLRDNALNGQRTVSQQRKINRALNGLMLSIAKRRIEARNNSNELAKA